MRPAAASTGQRQPDVPAGRAHADARRPARAWAPIAALLCLALAIRLTLIVATADLPLAADAADYVRHAQSIAAGDGYPATVAAGRGGTALRPPGFPYFLGAVWALTGGDETGARVAQALLGTVLVGLTGALALFLLGRRAALAALAMAAVYPPFVIGGTALVSEPLFTVLELAAVLALLLHLRSGAIAWALAAGSLAGLAVLTRPNGALLIAVLAGAALLARGSPRRPAAAAAVLAAAALTIAPWTVRNAIVLGDFVPVSTNGGYTLAGTYNATSRADPRFPAAWRPANFDPAMGRLLARAPAMTEPQVNAMLGDAARAYARDRPGYVAEVAARNALRLMSAGGRDYHHQATVSELGLGPAWSDLALFGFLPFAALAVAGAFTRLARRAPLWLWGVPAAMATVVVVLATQRFRMPIDPFLILLATAAVVTAGRQLAEGDDAGAGGGGRLSRLTGLSPGGLRLLAALLALGTGVRVVLAFSTYGVPFDIESAAIVAETLRTPGQGPYPTDRWPYPPGFFPLIVLADALARATPLPFHGLVQVPAIAADAILAAVVGAFLRRRGRSERAALAGAALVALGPSFAVISGYHGQIDAVAILPAVLGAVVWCAGGRRRALAAGLLVGLGAAVKTVPLFAALGLLPGARGRREAATLVAAAVAVPAAAVLPWLLMDHVNTLSALTQNKGVPGFGGLSAFVQPDVARFWSSLEDPPRASAAVEALRSVQNPLVGGAVLAAAALALRRRTPPLDALVLIWLTVLVVNPNFAFQYVVWALPFLLLAGRLRTVALLQAALVVPAVLLYTHWDSWGWIYWATVQLAWLVIVAAWVAELRAVLRRRPASAAPAPS